MDLQAIRTGEAAVSADWPVTTAAIIAYARATNDENPMHLAGRIAPPLFAVVPALKTMVLPKKVATPVHALHGEHDIHLHRPILPGMILRTTARLVGARPSRAGPVLVGHGETRSTAGELVNEQYITWVVRGDALDRAWGDAAPDHTLPDTVCSEAPLARVTIGLTDDQTRRYAEASGDRDAYTYDPTVARGFGYPAPIVHGLCTMAMASRALVSGPCGGDSSRLRRIAVRFSRILPMLPGQTISISIWPVGGQYGFEVADRDGHAVITNGRAELAPVP